MPSRSTGKPQIISTIIGGIFLIVAAIVSGLFLLRTEEIKQQIAPTQTAVAATVTAIAQIRPPSPTPNSTTATITYPTAGDEVPVRDTVSGKVIITLDDKNKTLWLYDYGMNWQRYYLSQIIIRPDGTWQVKDYVLGLPEGTGIVYKIGVLLADENATRQLLEKSDGLTTLPNGIKVLDEIMVKRK